VRPPGSGAEQSTPIRRRHSIAPMRSYRLRPSVPVVLIASLWGSACDSGTSTSSGSSATSTDPAPSKPERDAEPNQAAVETEPAAKPSPKPAAPKPAPAEAAKLRKQLLALLNDGRALTKKGDHAGGIAKYQEALKIDASDVSVLGELGWAAFKSGDLELAHRSTVQALKFVRADNQRGMLLYNLGRIEEDRDKLDAAIGHYEASLAARPNATVEARLTALRETQNAMAVAGSAGGELEGPDRYALGASLEPIARDLADLAAACKALEASRCEDYTMTEDEPCSCAPTLQATPGADASWGLLQLNSHDHSMQVAWFPAVQTDKGWTVFGEVLYSYNPGAFGIYEDVTVHPSTIEPVPGGSAKLVMKFDKQRVDRDMGVNEIETEDTRATVICSREASGAHCSKALVTHYHYLRELDFPDEDTIDGQPIDHDGLPSEEGFTATLELREGKLVVTRTETKGGFDRLGDVAGAFGWVLPAGEHLLAQILGLPD
jgi:tetratricopeptide (TPR) repeat protein